MSIPLEMQRLNRPSWEEFVRLTMVAQQNAIRAKSTPAQERDLSALTPIVKDEKRDPALVSRDVVHPPPPKPWEPVLVTDAKAVPALDNLVPLDQVKDNGIAYPGGSKTFREDGWGSSSQDETFRDRVDPPTVTLGPSLSLPWWRHITNGYASLLYTVVEKLPVKDFNDRTERENRFKVATGIIAVSGLSVVGLVAWWYFH